METGGGLFTTNNGTRVNKMKQRGRDSFELQTCDGIHAWGTVCTIPLTVRSCPCSCSGDQSVVVGFRRGRSRKGVAVVGRCRSTSSASTDDGIGGDDASVGVLELDGGAVEAVGVGHGRGDPCSHCGHGRGKAVEDPGALEGGRGSGGDVARGRGHDGGWNRGVCPLR